MCEDIVPVVETDEVEVVVEEVGTESATEAVEETNEAVQV